MLWVVSENEKMRQAFIFRPVKPNSQINTKEEPLVKDSRCEFFTETDALSLRLRICFFDDSI